MLERIKTLTTRFSDRTDNVKDKGLTPFVKPQNFLIQRAEQLRIEYQDTANRVNGSYDDSTNHGTIRSMQDIYNRNFGLGP